MLAFFLCPFGTLIVAATWHGFFPDDSVGTFNNYEGHVVLTTAALR